MIKTNKMKKTILILFTLMAVMASAQSPNWWKIDEYTIESQFGNATMELYGVIDGIDKNYFTVKLKWYQVEYRADTVYISKGRDAFKYSDRFDQTFTDFQHAGTTYPSVTMQQIWDSCAQDGEINLAPILSYIKHKAKNDPDFWKH